MGKILRLRKILPDGLLPGLGDEVAEPDEGSGIEDPSPYPLPEYRLAGVDFS
jgi:hypothetical protein